MGRKELRKWKELLRKFPHDLTVIAQNCIGQIKVSIGRINFLSKQFVSPLVTVLVLSSVYSLVKNLCFTFLKHFCRLSLLFQSVLCG